MSNTVWGDDSFRTASSSSTPCSANAQFKGLNTANLVITHINANKASKVMHSGRKRSRSAKRTNVEIVVQEKATKESVKKEVKEKKAAREEKK